MAVRAIPHLPSTNIAMIEYDDDRQELTIFFAKGGIYRYFEIDARTADGFSTALSPTSYMQFALEGVFPSERLA